MNSSVGFLFPGQGSQSVGMGKALFDSNPKVRSLFKDAQEILEYDIGNLCFHGPADQLNQTQYTQPALLVTSLACLQLLEGGSIQPSAVAGHSLGEYTALVAAGALDFKDAVRLVSQRGHYMAEAVPPGSGLVAAILGLSASQVNEICLEGEKIGVVAPANFNSPKQVVVAGERLAVENVLELAKSCGARRAIPIPVSVPVHTSLMEGAAQRLKKDIDSLTWSDLKVPLVNNVDAKALYSAQEVKLSLVQQLPSPVRWEQTIHTMSSMGISHFIEIGPGKVLTGLVKRILPEATTWNISDQETYHRVLSQVA